MKRTSGLALTVLVVAGMLAGCAGRRTTNVMVPPRIDLKQHETIGVIEFDTSSEGELGSLATRRFTDLARRDQGLVRIVSLDSTGPWNVDKIKALGRKHGVQTILVGELTVSDIRPDLRIAPSLRSGSLSAQVDATLAVQLIETASGASIWSTSARATQSVGHISVLGKDFAFDAEDPERAYGGLVDALVEQATRDFRVTRERRYTQ